MLRFNMLLESKVLFVFVACSGTWGVGCANTCGVCLSGTCDPVDGSCTGGCQDGYTGNNCNQGKYEIFM